MKRTWTAVLIVLPLLAACSEDPVAPRPAAPENPSLLAARAVHRFGGRCETALTVLAPLPGDTPNILRLHITYLCALRPMERPMTGVAEQIVTFTGPTTAIASNTTTYTAANGDKLFATWTGTATSLGPDVTFSGPETYTGGTGRFERASGRSWITGTASFITNAGQFRVEGTLAF